MLHYENWRIRPLLRRTAQRTTSRCPVCHAACPGEVWRVGGTPARVVLKRTCPEPGAFSACLASDARFYWLAKGNPENACCGGGASACCSATGETAARSGAMPKAMARPRLKPFPTCLALIEIVQSCNLACPTCYANSPVGTGASLDAVPLAELQQRIQGVIDRKGKIGILQLSGGEPTLHPEFFALIEWAHAHPGIDYLLLNTNGVRLANDPTFTRRLGQHSARGGLQLYLQFDGVQEAGQHWLRGAGACAKPGPAPSPAVPRRISHHPGHDRDARDLSHIWEAIAFGLAHENVHGITFQPMFGSGRAPRPATGTEASPSIPGSGPAHHSVSTPPIFCSPPSISPAAPCASRISPPALRGSKLRHHRLSHPSRRTHLFHQRLRGLPPASRLPQGQGSLHLWKTW